MLESNDGAQSKVRAKVCPRCFKPVDPLDANSQRNGQTRQWEHKECRTSPRVHPRFPVTR
jgi:hypothetical protein